MLLLLVLLGVALLYFLLDRILKIFVLLWLTLALIVTCCRGVPACTLAELVVILEVP